MRSTWTDSRLDELNNRVGRLDDRVARLEDRVGSVEDRLDELGGRIDSLHTAFVHAALGLSGTMLGGFIGLAGLIVAQG